MAPSVEILVLIQPWYPIWESLPVAPKQTPALEAT
jgi:hypothetical protein